MIKNTKVYLSPIESKDNVIGEIFPGSSVRKLKKDKSTTLLDVKNKMVENGIVEYVINKSNVKTLSMSFSEIMDD